MVTTVQPLWLPSTGLPPLARISQVDSSTIAFALQTLRNLYWPTSTSIPQALTSKSKVRQKRLPVSRIRSDELVPDSGYASAEGDDSDEDDGADVSLPASNSRVSSDDPDTGDEAEILRSDALERAYAIKWTTGFVSRSDAWVCSADDADTDARSQLVDIASQILSAFSGVEPEDEEAAAITRTFSFCLSPLDSSSPSSITTLDVQLNDAALLSEDHTSVGLQSWGSAIILAERICCAPSDFGLDPSKSLRVLELGAGTGLLSIVAAKLLPASSTIIATDYHPDVLANLSINVDVNFPAGGPSLPIHVSKLDWESPVYDSDPFDKPFDIILAADVVYDPHHAQWIHSCVEQLLAKPSLNPEGDGYVGGGVFWLLIPIRSIGRHEGLYLTVDAVFPDISRLHSTEDGGDRHREEAWTLVILAKEEIQRRAGGVGRVDEVGYRLFKIGWARGRV